MPFEGLTHKALGSCKVASLAEPELHCVAAAVDGAVKVYPTPTHLDIGLVNVPLPADGLLAPIEPLEKLGQVTDLPATDGGVVDGDASLGHHLFEISEAQAVSEIPPHAEQDYRSIELPALEHLASPSRWRRP
jgi:hypothetical protein